MPRVTKTIKNSTRDKYPLNYAAAGRKYLLIKAGKEKLFFGQNLGYHLVVLFDFSLITYTLFSTTVGKIKFSSVNSSQAIDLYMTSV